MELILSPSSWGRGGFLSRSKQFKERDKKNPDYPKNAVLFGAQLWFCISAAAKRKNLGILLLEAIQVCWGGLTPRLLDCRDSPASDVKSPETETALKSPGCSREMSLPAGN